ncbi:hypothetical protein [Candidatus Pantoea carbekii]|uniref:Uncharacterized protein n=1 Tax=Candidatus Pantoea carbekii TaxID=1235990 RepID=U3U2M2_9GAMM|nr:hypothetical protein [Candidatus Pantoea carbekii]AKC31867.1 hypothetical protein BMSBPS_0036 [Candidatus Pantoea carbekii]BAO00381.1 hypothetical protein HHS_04110 [Candidatus Pantoea carbekii]
MPETWINNNSRTTLHGARMELPLKHISWSSIFVGVIAALIVHITLSLLGTAIGATTINPLQEQNPFQHIGNSALIWTSLNMLLSIGLGSFIAGRLAQHEGALHGLLVFGISTIITLWLTISFASSVIGGVFNIVGHSVNALSQGVSNIAPSLTKIVKEKLQENNINLENFQNELKELINKATTPVLESNTLQKNINNQIYNVQEKNNNINRNIHTDVDITNWVRNVVNSHHNRLEAKDRDILKKIIKLRNDIDDREAEKIVNQFETRYRQTIQKFQQLKQQAEQKARKAAEQAVSATAKTSWYIFFMLLIESLLSAILGSVGQRRQTSKC